MATGKGIEVNSCSTLSRLAVAACTGHVLPVEVTRQRVSTAALTEDPERRDHLQLAAHTPGFSLLVQCVPLWTLLEIRYKKALTGCHFPLKWPGLLVLLYSTSVGGN